MPRELLLLCPSPSLHILVESWLLEEHWSHKESQHIATACNSALSNLKLFDDLHPKRNAKNIKKLPTLKTCPKSPRNPRQLFLNKKSRTGLCFYMSGNCSVSMSCERNRCKFAKRPLYDKGSHLLVEQRISYHALPHARTGHPTALSLSGQ